MGFKRAVLAALIAIASIGPVGSLSSAPPLPPANISSHVLQSTEGNARVSFLAILREQADLRPAALLHTKAEKGRFVYEALRQTALRSQAPLRAALDRAGIRYHAYYIVNVLEITGDRETVLKLAARPDVARIQANPQIPNFKLETLNSQPATQDPKPEIRTAVSAEWNIQKVNAPQAWAMGYTGQGIVVAGADTGYQWDHPALRSHYRGWNGIAATHDYNWHDAVDQNPAPLDPHGHGTHTMGTMVGDDGVGNRVGTAPGAQWIGCRNMDAGGFGTPARYIECFEFFLAPYPFGGDPLTQGVPELAPAVIGNSWSCPPDEGCDPDDNGLRATVDAVRAAGIEVVAAAQNYGWLCSTVHEPIGTYRSTFTVGATDGTDAIAGFSSRGPVTIDGSGRLKPDISAPGVGVRSAFPTNSWASLQGTSMATPHVAGLFALVWSAAPGLVGHLAETEYVITSTAVHLTTDEGCGGDAPTSVPNNVYGWGRIDALAATLAVSTWPSLWIDVTAPTGPISPTDLLTYTLVVGNPSATATNDNVIVTDTLPSGLFLVRASDGGVYSPAARMVTWSTPTLAAQTSISYTLEVAAGNAFGRTIVANHNYGARSDQVIRTVGGPPVTTIISGSPYLYYFPVVFICN